MSEQIVENFCRLQEDLAGDLEYQALNKEYLARGVVCFRRLLNQSIGKSPKTYNLITTGKASKTPSAEWQNAC